MSFNLYYAGSQNKLAETYIEDNNLLRLMSYYHEKNLIAGRCSRGLPTFVDSGAFSAYTKGTEIDVDEYIDFVNTHMDSIFMFAQVDKIPGEFGKPKTKEQLDEATELTWQNYLYMRERVKDPDKLIAVFHRGDDWSLLHKILNFEPKIQFMAFGALVGVPTPERAAFIAKAFKIIHASPNPDIKVHGFGMTSLPLLTKFPFYSADSTTWIMTAANGGIMTKFGTLNVSENGIGDKKNVMNQGEYAVKIISDYVEQYGFNLKELAADYKARTIWNILYLKRWSEEYKYEPANVSQTKLF